MASKLRPIERGARRSDSKSEPIKIELRRLRDSTAALNWLIQQALSASLSFDVARMARAAKTELDLLEETTQKMKAAHPEVTDPPEAAQYLAELDELLSKEVELPGVNIRPADLKDPAPVVFMQLDWLIKE